MKLKALSHYDNDMDTRFGDCILLYDETSLVVYDCGHSRHAQEVEAFLEKHSVIKAVDVVVSHNDSDHTGGVCELLNWLKDSGKYTVRVFTHQYLKYVDKILDTVDDGRRDRESLKKSLLEKFDHIKEIIETATDCGFDCVNAVPDTAVGTCTIVGPTEDEFIEVAAKAIDSRESDNIGEGDAQETVMNAASVQLKCTLSGGSDKLVDFMKKGKYDAALNTKNGVVELPLFSASSTLKGAEKERVCLCDLDCV